MSLTQVIVTSATVSILVLVASVGLFSYAVANGASTIPGNMHGGFKRMHMGNSHDEKMQHIKSYCKEDGKQKLQHMVSYIEDRFELSDTQTQEWNKVVNALYSEENTIKVICDKILTKENHETTPARMELMETVVLTGLEAMQRVRPTVEVFYSSLDDKQKRTLDDLLSHRNHRDHL
ncbi:MAG: Spy/CpxP family protein refolding chaperone [Gammaproteobacteria bacterium]|nr:Spy/CpxP family protein refolding chaperone [Gammaproteobacteria bacterium]